MAQATLPTHPISPPDFCKLAIGATNQFRLRARDNGSGTA